MKHITDNLVQFFDQHNLLHCENGPAYIDYDQGYEGWFKHGKSHRLDGPARIRLPCYSYPKGFQEWWYEGNPIEVNSQAEFEKWLKLQAFW